MTASSDDQSHHFAKEASLQWVEIIVRLKECVDRVQQRLRSDEHLRDLIHIRRDQITCDVWIPAITVADNTTLIKRNDYSSLIY